MDATQMADGTVTLALTKSEALVLSDWLHRIETEDPELALGMVDQAEQRVIWDLSASLERVLVEPFSSEYAAIIDEARAEVRDATD